MGRAIAGFVLIFCAFASVQAETVPPLAAAACSRASLQAIAEQYVEALKKGDPSLMPLASQAKYIERRKEIPLGQGIWKTPLVVDFYRTLVDVDICETFTEVISARNTPQYVTGTR